MNNNQNPEEQNTENEETPTDSIMDSIKFVVDMMNSGKPRAEDVYPRGRYHGD